MFLTASRAYASLYAHNYPRGDLYVAEPLGALKEDPDAPRETYIAEAATVVAVVRRGVVLPPHKLDQALKVARVREALHDLASEVLGEHETAAIAAGLLYSPGPAGIADGDVITPAAQWGGGDSDAVFVTDSPGRALARAGTGQAVYQVRPIGRLMCVRRDGLVEGGVPAAIVRGGPVEDGKR